MKTISNIDDIRNFIIERLKTHINNNNLVAIIGSGFTKDEKASSGFKVPDLNSICDLMIEQIYKSTDKFGKEELISIKKNYKRLAKLFYNNVTEKERVLLLKKYFTNVTLSKQKKQLLEINWSYIITLNFDDAIEKNSKYSPPLVPYKKLREDIDIRRERVIKIHGDANHEISYPNEKTIIFSSDQYLESIKNNGSLLEIFKDTLYTKNVIFIGCSLDEEIDLQSALDKSDLENYHRTIDRVYLTCSSLSALELETLAEYGINIVLKFDNYNLAYDTLTELLVFDNKEVIAKQFKYYEKIKLAHKDKSLSENQPFLSGEKQIIVKDNKVELPFFFISRGFRRHAVESLIDNDINLFIGRRQSGKSYFAIDLYNSIKNKTRLYFPSTIVIDIESIAILLSEWNNSLLIFDTYSLDENAIKYLFKNAGLLKQNKITVIIFANSSDRMVISFFNNFYNFEEIFTIQNYFDKKDLANINNKLSQIGFPNFSDKISILENIHRYNINRNPKYYGQLNKIADSLTDVDIKVIILSATFDTVYSLFYQIINVSENEINILSKNINFSIEIEYDLKSFENSQFSGFKTVTNSKSYLFDLLGTYISIGFDEMENVSRCIVNIVKHFIMNNKRKYRDIILFDNLNSIFSKKRNKGNISLIYKIYKDLRDVLFEDPHYWIQRAKSIHRLKNDDITELNEALQYADKAYQDSFNIDSVRQRACLLYAMIIGTICYLESYKDGRNLEIAILKYYEALNDSFDNVSAVKDIIENSKSRKSNNDLYNLVSHIYTHPEFINNNLNLKNEAEFLIRKILGHYWYKF